MKSAFIGHRVSGQGEPLLLLNGALMSLAAWQPVVTVLEKSFRVVRCDFRGQFFSLGEPQPDLDSHLADVLALLDHLELSRVHIAGTSFGSLLGLRLAARHPERVASLAAVTSTDRITEESWRELAVVQEACLAAADGGDGGRVSDLTLHMFSDEFRARQSALMDMQREWISALPAKWFRGIAGILEAVNRIDLRPELPQVRCPVLVLAAEKDVIFPIERSQALAVALPSARLEVVPGAGHSIVVESPGPLAEALLRFFKPR